jgi:hypothetical protein
MYIQVKEEEEKEEGEEKMITSPRVQFLSEYNSPEKGVKLGMSL